MEEKYLSGTDDLARLTPQLSQIRLVALDLDDTTLGAAGELASRTRAALEAAAAAGPELVVATGRAFTAIPPEVSSLSQIRYAITTNGASVYELSTGRLLRARRLPPHCVEALLAWLPEEILALDAFLDGNPHAERKLCERPWDFGIPPFRVEYFQRTRTLHNDIRPFIRENLSNLDGLALWCNSPEVAESLHHRIREQMPELYLALAPTGLVEIAHPEAGKASGLRFLSQRLSIPREQILALGNGNNDVDMLSWSGLSIAVANATPACQAAADYITTAHTDFGVARVLEALTASLSSTACPIGEAVHQRK